MRYINTSSAILITWFLLFCWQRQQYVRTEVRRKKRLDIALWMPGISEFITLEDQDILSRKVMEIGGCCGMSLVFVTALRRGVTYIPRKKVKSRLLISLDDGKPYL